MGSSQSALGHAGSPLRAISREKCFTLHSQRRLYRERSSESAVVEKAAELKVSPNSQTEPQIMSSQALKATVQQSVRMASQVVEQQSRHGGGFVWRAGVGYQYQGGQGGQQPQASEQQWKDQRQGQFTQGLGWEHLHSSKGHSS